MVHAITRQESQFAQNAVSHAGARGLMQLMPGTAQEQAGKLGMTYMSADLIDSPSYNIQLGNGYFARLMDYFGGSYPPAIEIGGAPVCTPVTNAHIACRLLLEKP